jgi:putative transposase
VKTYKYRLKTNRQFEREAARTLDVCRELYNASIQERRDAYHINHVTLNYHSQRAQLPEIKQIRDDLKEVHSQVLQDVLRRSEKAFDHFFRRLKLGQVPGYPRFKSRDRYDSLTYPQSGFRLAGDKLHLSKIGSCRLRLSRPIEGIIKTCTIKRECDGWSVAFAVEPNHSKFIPKTGAIVGIDLGLESFATLSTGEKIDNPRFFRESEERLAAAQRKLATKKLRSGKRRAARKVVAKVHRKIGNQRTDFAHKQVNKLLRRFDGIAVEDLQVKNLTGSNLAKSIHDASWSTFNAILFYKAEEAGRKVVKVDPRYTSQNCSACGRRQKIELSVRRYECLNCQLSIDRDHNAAINILVRAEPRLKAGISTYSRAVA